jgi:hypothetical protein
MELPEANKSSAADKPENKKNKLDAGEEKNSYLF